MMYSACNYSRSRLLHVNTEQTLQLNKVPIRFVPGVRKYICSPKQMIVRLHFPARQGSLI